MIPTLYEVFRHWSDGGSDIYYRIYTLMIQIDGLFDFMDAIDVDANTIIGAGVTSNRLGTPSIDVMLSQQEEKTRMYLTKVFFGMIEEFPG